MLLIPHLNKLTALILFLAGSLNSVAQQSPSRFWGISDDISFADTASISQLRNEFGKQPALVSYALAWKPGGMIFPAAECNRVRTAGSIPFISIDPAISLTDILKGLYNRDLEQFGAAIKAFNGPVFIRFAREPNSDWNTWNGSKNPEGARIYTDAYRYVVDKIRDAGGVAAIWVWTVNSVDVPDQNNNNMLMYYPGDRYADWIGIDGYNYGTSQSWSAWATFDDIFSKAYNRIIEAHPAKPVMLAETACATTGGDKALWISSMFASLTTGFTQIRAIVWNNRTTPADWRLSSPETAAAAWAAGLADPSFASDLAGIGSLHLHFPAYIRPVPEGFLKATGKKITDGTGREVLLRGMGLGGWMLQEGYMLETGDFAGTQHEIKAKIKDLIGQDGTQKFYDAWLANHVTRADIDTLARWGFNSVRPALHYNLFTLPIEDEPVGGRQTWLDKGFILLDSLVSWCAANKMYVILDLHAAPGGQGRDNNISDRDPAKLSLWESAANRTKTIELWRKLAERYAGNPWVGGYDILNETNWDFENSGNQNGCNCQQNAPLLDLFKKIITAIRSKDTKHLIFIEGNCWSGNYNGLMSLTTFDNNLAFSFHRYWNRNDAGTIQEKLDIRDQYDVPLWMGESGENSNHWFAEAVSLLESHDIGWSWWPEKKINSVVGPLTVTKTPEYDQLLRYWKSGGTRPNAAFATAALMQITENLKIANCAIHYDVPDALFRQQRTSETKAFTQNRVPGTVYAVNFDMGRNNFAYSDKDFENTGGQGSTQWNLGFVYRNDGPDIEPCTDSAAYSNGYNINHIEKGEWMVYTFCADSTGVYNLSVRTAAASSMGVFRIEIDGINVTGSVAVPHTGGFQRFMPVNLKNIGITAGSHKMAIYMEEGGFTLNSFVFTGPTGATGVPFTMLSAKTDDMGRQIILTFNGQLSGYPAAGSAFMLSSGTNTFVPDSVTLESVNPPALRLWFRHIFSDTDALKISYSGSSIISVKNEVLPSFTDVPVVNTILPRLPVPGIIEAENCSVNSGFIFEACSDAGGGLDAGWTDPGDYLDFSVNVEAKALYKITCRYACNSGISGAELLLITDSVQSIQTVTFAATGGWQVWNSVSISDTLPAGPSTIRFRALTAGFNLNRIEFVKVPDSNDTTKIVNAGFRVYPNPAENFVIVEISNPKGQSQQLELMDMLGHILYKQDTPSAITAKCTVDTTGYLPGIYLIRVGGEQTFGTRSFLIKNMKP